MKIIVNGQTIEAETVEIETVCNRITIDGVADTLMVNDIDHAPEYGTTHLIADLYDMEIDEEQDDDGELARDHILERQELEDFEGEQFHDMYDNGDY